MSAHGYNMRPRLLLSVLLIAIVGAVAGGLVTRAFFTDTETSTGSEFEVGTLDLDVGGANGSNVLPFQITNIGATGDISGEQTWTVNNSGSLPGRLYFKLLNVQNHENACNEPEAIIDATCDNPGTGQGELGGVITANVYLDDVLQVSSDLTTANEAVIGNSWNALSPIIIPAGGSVDVKIAWDTDEDDYGNEVQSDSVTFDIQFDLEQITEQTIIDQGA